MLAIKIWMTSSTMMVLMAMTPIAAAASARELQNLDSRLEASASQSLCEASEEKAEALSQKIRNHFHFVSSAVTGASKI